MAACPEFAKRHLKESQTIRKKILCSGENAMPSVICQKIGLPYIVIFFTFMLPSSSSYKCVKKLSLLFYWTF